jgi:disulfide bond formation protein DsbB
MVSMNPLRWSYRVSFFVGFLICVGLLGFALFAEYQWGLEPCPLCIFQRIGFMVMAVFFLIGAIHGPRAGGRWFYTGFVLLGALFGIVVAARHLWIMSLPADQVPACGPNLAYMFDAFPFQKALKMVFTGSGECAKIQPLLGLPIPLWALLWFVLLSILAIRASLQRATPRLRL